MEEFEVEIVVPGSPVGKGRPRFAKRGNFISTYTPEKTVVYENLIKCEYERQSGYRFPDTSPLRVIILAYFEIPKSVSKKKRVEMIKGYARPTKKPDLDNIAKCYLDALNGVAYKDDVQVVECCVEKYFSENPRVKIRIVDLDLINKQEVIFNGNISTFTEE